MNVPIRSAVLGSRLSSSARTISMPIALPSSAATAARQQRRQKYYHSMISSSSPSIRCQAAAAQKLLAIIRSSPPALMLCRAFATTSTSSSQQRPDQQQSPSSSTTTAPAKLDWNTFFTLRASRRRYSLISSIIAALGTTSAGLTVLLTQNLEVIGAQMMGLDPIAVMVLGTAACGAVGWLAGPFVGTGLWRWRYRNQKDAVAVKEKEFYERIKRFRVDPSAQSYNNPVPDYYGEKIGSVQGYRRWLKDQRAYNRKKSRFLI